MPCISRTIDDRRPPSSSARTAISCRGIASMSEEEPAARALIATVQWCMSLKPLPGTPWPERRESLEERCIKSCAIMLESIGIPYNDQLPAIVRRIVDGELHRAKGKYGHP